MSQFRDTFSKEDKKESLLDYDDSASLYFGATILLSVIVPWSIILGRFLTRKARSKRSPEGLPVSASVRLCQCTDCKNRDAEEILATSGFRKKLTNGIVFQILALIVLWVLLAYLAYRMYYAEAILRFDPFGILEVSPDASLKQIRKAYHVMSLRYHPDKNPNDPTAAAKFVMISKGYQSLTDEIAKTNFEKYGNPDGPGVMKVGIGLPRFLVKEDNQLFILLVFFLVLLVILPLIFFKYYQTARRFAPNGVLYETLEHLAHNMSEGTRVKHLPELMAASAECREIPFRPSDPVDLKSVSREVQLPKKPVFQNPVISKANYLIVAHMQRLHHTLSPPLRADLDFILGTSLKVTQAMLEIALYHQWVVTMQAIVDFRRCLVQAMELHHPSLMQVPHYESDIIKQVTGKNRTPLKSLRDFVKQRHDEKQGIQRITAEKDRADVIAFSEFVSVVNMEVSVKVEDEAEISVGDIATVDLSLRREDATTSEENMPVGPVHAPFFPKWKLEEWIVILLDKPSGQLLAINSQKMKTATVDMTLQFPVMRAGPNHMLIMALSDSYFGRDCPGEASFKALAEGEARREILVHPEDAALDNEPTVFQRVMGQMDPGEESSDDDDLEVPPLKATDGTEKQTADQEDEDADVDSDDDDDE